MKDDRQLYMTRFARGRGTWVLWRRTPPSIVLAGFTGTLMASQNTMGARAQATTMGNTRNGAVHRPLFHDLQLSTNEKEPGGSGRVDDCADETRTAAPAAGEVNN